MMLQRTFTIAAAITCHAVSLYATSSHATIISATIPLMPPANTRMGRRVSTTRRQTMKTLLPLNPRRTRAALALLGLILSLAMTTSVHSNDFKNLNMRKRFDEAQYVLLVRPSGSSLFATAKAGNSDVENLAMSLSAQRHWEQQRMRVGTLTAHYSVALFEVIARYKTPVEHGGGRALVKPVATQMPAPSHKEVIALRVLTTNEGNNGYNRLSNSEVLVFAKNEDSPKRLTGQPDALQGLRDVLAMQSVPPSSMPQHILTGDTVLINTLPDPTETGIEVLFKQTGHPFLLDNLSASLRLPQTYRGGPTWLNVGLSPMPNSLERGVVVDPKDCRRVTVYRYLDPAEKLDASSEMLTYRFIPKVHKQGAAMPPLQPIQLQTVILPSTTANGIPFLPSIDIAYLNLPECGWIQLNVTKNGKPVSEPYWYRAQAQ